MTMPNSAAFTQCAMRSIRSNRWIGASAVGALRVAAGAGVRRWGRRRGHWTFPTHPSTS